MARRAGIALDDVLGTAAAMADRDGLEAVTLSRLATALGIRSPSLYAHVQGLPGLRRLLALRAAGILRDTLTTAIAGRTGPDALRAAAFAFRDAIRAHPGLYAATLPVPRPDDDPELYAALAEAARPVVDAAAAAGLTGAAAVHATRAIRAAVHGFAALEETGGFGQPHPVEESFTVMIDALVPTPTPSRTTLS